MKVGFGQNPARRLHAYSEKYNLTADRASLRTWEIPSSGIASNIETQCHNVLLELGFKRLNISSDDNEAKEIFAIEKHRYEAIVELVIEEIDNGLDYLKKQLNTHSNYRDIERRKNQKQKIIQEKKDSLNKEAETLKQLLKRDYSTHYSTLQKAITTALKHRNKMPFKQRSSLTALFLGYKQGDEEFLKWGGYEKCVANTPAIFYAQRKVKQALYSQIMNFSSEAISIVEKERGHSLNSVIVHTEGSRKTFDLPTVFAGFSDYMGSSSIGMAEVILCAQISSLEGGNVGKVMAEHSSLATIINYANRYPAPELSYYEKVGY